MEVGEEFLDNHYTVPYWTCTTTQPTMRNQRVDCDIDRPRILDKLYVNTTMVEELHKACQLDLFITYICWLILFIYFGMWQLDCHSLHRLDPHCSRTHQSRTHDLE